MEKKNVIGNREKKQTTPHDWGGGKLRKEFSSLSESIFNQILLT